jgi:hypothetical protein
MAFTLRLDATLDSALTCAAKSEGITKIEYVRRLLRECVPTEPADLTPDGASPSPPPGPAETCGCEAAESDTLLEPIL